MKRFQTFRPFALGAALVLAACPGAQTKPDGRETGPTGKSPTSGGDGKQAASDKPPRPEDLVNSKSLRLFDDAVKAYSDQRGLKVFDWNLLEKKFQFVVDADDRFAEAYFNLGVIYERQRKPDEARKAYRRALDRKPSLKQAAENLAVMAENEGKPAEAAEMYREILRKYPEDGAARARLASLFRETGEFEKAMRFAREALMREPGNLTAYKVMMRSYLDRNNLNMAKLVALRATRLQQDPELYFTMGLIALKENDEQTAVGQFKQALKERDDFMSARVALANIAVRHRDWLNAGEQYKKIVQYDPKNVAARVNLGLSYKGLGQVDKAMAEYDAAIKADSRVPEPYFFLGVIFHRNKDAPEKGIEYYKKFIEVSGGSVAGDHPVYEAIKDAEQYIHQLQEAKLAEERAKREAEEKKRLDEQKKKEDADKAKAEEEAKKREEKERRQREAKEAVDGALKGGDVPKDKEPEKEKPAEKPANPKARPESKAETKAEPKPEAKPTAKGALEEPKD